MICPYWRTEQPHLCPSSARPARSASLALSGRNLPGCHPVGDQSWLHPPSPAEGLWRDAADTRSVVASPAVRKIRPDRNFPEEPMIELTRNSLSLNGFRLHGNQSCLQCTDAASPPVCFVGTRRVCRRRGSRRSRKDRSICAKIGGVAFFGASQHNGGASFQRASEDGERLRQDRRGWQRGNESRQGDLKCSGFTCGSRANDT